MVVLVRGRGEGVVARPRTSSTRTSSTHSRCTRMAALAAMAGAVVRPWARRRAGAVHRWGRMAAHLEGQACRHGLVRLAIRAILVEARAVHHGDLARQVATAGVARRRGLVGRMTRRGKVELQDRLVTTIISHPRHRRGVAANAAARAIATEQEAVAGWAARASPRHRRRSGQKTANRRVLAETGTRIEAAARVETETETETETEPGPETATGEIGKAFQSFTHAACAASYALEAASGRTSI